MSFLGDKENKTDDKCPVLSFKTYIEHLNPENPFMWQQALQKIDPEKPDIWYSKKKRLERILLQYLCQS